MTEPRTVSVDDLPAPASSSGGDGSSSRPVYLDVREDAEFAAGHVPGAIHIPLGELPERAGELPSGEVHALCRTGGRATKAARWLDENGRDAVVVQGGTIAWAEAGKPLDFEGEEPQGGAFVR